MANHVTQRDAALVGVSRLGRDHSRIYMVMKSEKLFLFGPHFSLSFEEMTGARSRRLQRLSSRSSFYFSFHVHTFYSVVASSPTPTSGGCTELSRN